MITLAYLYRFFPVKPVQIRVTCKYINNNYLIFDGQIVDNIILMLSKNKSKLIISLQKKKVRDEEKLYVIEGDKMVREFLAAGVEVRLLAAKPEFIRSLSPDLLKNAHEVNEVSFDELKSISTLKTPHNALAIVSIDEKEPNPDEIFGGLACALEYVQDPGNLGTIIRAAGWFGIKTIICSSDSVDLYNPRVVQASMGALLHVSVFYINHVQLLSEAKMRGLPVFGTVLEGENIYDQPLDTKGIILFGNESKGISSSLLPFLTHRIMIPRFSTGNQGIDSLNVGMAASIVFSEFRRRSGIIT